MNRNVRTLLESLLKQRILVLDGAMGTMIQRLKFTEADFRGERFASHSKDLRGNSDVLVLTQPDAIAGIHHQYLEAGSDIIETNTFNGTSLVQSDYGLESLAYELNVAASRLARAATDEWTRRTPDQPRFVAGSIGPMNRTLSISPDVNNPALRASTFDEVKNAFKEQMGGLIDGGCDLLLLETIFDSLNAKAALVGLDELYEERGTPDAERVPLMISVTVTDRSGRTLSGQTIDAFWTSVRHSKPFSIGRDEAAVAKRALSFGVNAGTVLVKVGISAVSVEGARKNLDAEIAGWDFEQVRRAADAAWERGLAKIRVRGGSVVEGRGTRGRRRRQRGC